MVVLTMLWLFWHMAVRKVRAHAQHVENIGRVHIILHGIRWMQQMLVRMTVKVVSDMGRAMCRRGGGVRGEEGGGIGGMMGRVQSGRCGMIDGL